MRVQDYLGVDKIPGGYSLVQGLAKSRAAVAAMSDYTKVA